MPGDKWQKLANLALYIGYMYAHPGANFMFMGSEFGQEGEWDFQNSLDWNLLEDPRACQNEGFCESPQSFSTKTRPRCMKKPLALKALNGSTTKNHEDSIISFIRKGHDAKNDVIAVCNFTPVVREKLPIRRSSNRVIWSKF